MTIYLTRANQSLTADVGPFADVSFNEQRLAISNEEGNPTVFVWNETALGIASDDTAFSFSDGTVMRFAAPIEVSSKVTATSDSFTIKGSQSGIDYIYVNEDTLDFTTGSLSGAEGSTGITLSISGFGEELDAFIEPIFGNKTLQVSLDGNTWVTVVGNDASIDLSGNNLDTTIFGSNFNSSITGIINHTFSTNAIFRESAGYAARIRNVGSPISFTDEVTSRANGYYEITNRSKSLFNHHASFTIKDSGLVVPLSNIDFIDYLQGRIKFKTTYIPVGVITITGEYLPTSTYGCFNSFDLNQSTDIVETGCFDTLRSNGGYQTYKPTLRDVSISAEGFYNTPNNFIETLQSRDRFIIELDIEGNGESVCRGYFTLNSDSLSGGVGGDETEAVEFMLSVITGVKPFSWRFGSNTKTPISLQYAINAWENKQSLWFKYFPQGSKGIVYFGESIVTDCSVSNSIDGIAEASLSGQGSGALSIVNNDFILPSILITSDGYTLTTTDNEYLA